MKRSTLTLCVLFLSCAASNSSRENHTELFALYAAEPCPGKTDYDLEIGFDRIQFCIVGERLLGMQHIDQAEVEEDTLLGGFNAKITLTAEGKEEFARITRQHTKKYLGVVLKGAVRSAPKVMQRITSGILYVHSDDEFLLRSAVSEINHSR